MTTCPSDYVRHAENANDVYKGGDEDGDERAGQVGENITHAGTGLFARVYKTSGAEGAVSRDYWGGTSLSYTTPQKVAVVEAFQGEQWRKGENYRNPGYSTAQNFSIN